MTARDQITPAGLEQIPAGTPVTLISSRQGYAVAVGQADRVRWLHSHSGQFHLFRSADRAAALLNACGVRRFAVDLSGGTPQ